MEKVEIVYVKRYKVVSGRVEEWSRRVDMRLSWI